MRRLYWMIPILLLVALSACQGSRWKEFTSQEGKFSVEMPGKPDQQVEKLQTDSGEIDTYIFTAKLDDLSFGVSYADYPVDKILRTSIEQMLQDAGDGAVSRLDGKLESDQRIKYENKFPGREFKVSAGDGQHTLIERVYLFQDRLFQVLVYVPNDKADSAYIDRFFNSFKINY